MIDDLGKLYEKLSLTEEECEEVVVEATRLEDVICLGEKCLNLKLLTEWNYNREAFKQARRKIWHPIKSVEFQDLERILMLAEFDEIKGKDRVQWDGPWSFDMQLVLTKEFDGTLQVHDIQWVKLFFGSVSMICLLLRGMNMWESKLACLWPESKKLLWTKMKLIRGNLWVLGFALISQSPYIDGRKLIWACRNLGGFTLRIKDYLIYAIIVEGYNMGIRIVNSVSMCKVLTACLGLW